MPTASVQYHLGQFPPKTLDWPRLIPLIGPANAGLARYDGLLSAIPNAQVLLSPLTTQEAVLSSKIEGTHVTIGEVLEIEAGAESEALTQPKRDDAEEVLNYRKAMRACVAEMEHRPLSQQMLRAAHALLMQGVRGRDKAPGSPWNICKPEWMPGKSTWEVPTNWMHWFSLPFSMSNSRLFTPSRMGTVVWDEC